MDKLNNIILSFVIFGVIFWCIGIDEANVHEKFIGSISIAIATILNLYALFKGGI